MADEATTEQAIPTAEDGEEVDEEEKKRLEEERSQAEDLLREAEAKAAAKLELKKRNQNADSERPSRDDLKKLDGSVKKNSGFVKKLRNISEQQRAALTKDLNSLNLTKYVLEAANSIAEAKLKLSDVGCAVHICSLLHQKYTEFSPELLAQLQKIYSTGIGKDEDKSAVTTKFRLGLRLTGELLLAGVIDEELGTSLLTDMLTAVTKRADKEGHPYLSVVVGFARHCSEDLAGIIPRRQRALMRKFQIEPPKSQLLPESKQEQFRSILLDYFNSVRSYLVKEHKAMHKRERQNYQILTSKGEISEERRLDNETAQKLYDKVLSSTSTLAELLDEDMPDLPEYQAPQEQSDISIELQFPSGIADASEADPNSLWEDEDTRSFYEGITDIKPFVPAILYEGRKKTPSESSDSAAPTEESSTETTPMEEDEEKVLEQMIKDTEEASVDDEVGVDLEDEASGLGAESGASALLDEFIMRLPTLMNRKFVDEFAVEFCMSMNTKTNRRKLARALFNVDRNRMDLITFYARLVATLHPCLDDIATTLVEMLIKDLRFQIKKKDQIHIHSKLKNVRFIAELTKFGLCPKAETMKCITLLLHDFTHHNLEMACLFIEHCGRYLIRCPESHLRAKALLEIMVRKKRVQHLDGRQRSLVENALYYANPPETPQIVHVSLPPMLQYIKKLLYKDLNKINTEKILKQMRKLPWTEPQVFQWAVTSLVQIWNVKFNNVHCVANLLAGLKPYQEDAVVRVVDGVLEDIRLSLELNIPKMNQRRFSGMKYLGELYSYQLVESSVVFRTLYLMLQFGATLDGRPSPLDPQDSYFRVRLVCILLDTCGHYFDHGSTKKKLDAFLVFFQCYLFMKRQPLPLEVDHMVQDTIEGLRSDLEMFKSHQEAVEAAMELERKYKDKIGHEDEGGEESDDDDEERAGAPLHEEDGDEEGEDEGEGEGEGEDMDEEPFDEPNQLLDEEPEPVLKTAPKLMACPEDDEFLSAFEKMMSEEIQTSRTEAIRAPVIDTAVPMHLKGPKVKQRPLVHEEGELRMKFTFMTKKGHKQQLKDLSIPVDSDLASNIHEAREALRDRHQEMKKLVLNYEQQQEEEEYLEMVAREKEEMRKAKQAVAASQRKQQQPTPYQQQQHFYQQLQTLSEAVEGSYSSRGQGRGQYSHRGRGRGGGGGGRGYANDRPHSGQHGYYSGRGGGGGGGGGGGAGGVASHGKRGNRPPQQQQQRGGPQHAHHHPHQEQPRNNF